MTAEVYALVTCLAFFLLWARTARDPLLLMIDALIWLRAAIVHGGAMFKVYRAGLPDAVREMREEISNG